MNSIILYLSIKKRHIIAQGLPCVELNEDMFKGFISDMFQVIMSENYIDITDGDTNIQIQFSSSCEITTLTLADKQPT